MCSSHSENFIIFALCFASFVPVVNNHERQKRQFIVSPGNNPNSGRGQLLIYSSEGNKSSVDPATVQALANNVQTLTNLVMAQSMIVNELSRELSSVKSKTAKKNLFAAKATNIVCTNKCIQVSKQVGSAKKEIEEIREEMRELRKLISKGASSKDVNKLNTKVAVAMKNIDEIEEQVEGNSKIEIAVKNIEKTLNKVKKTIAKSAAEKKKHKKQEGKDTPDGSSKSGWPPGKNGGSSSGKNSGGSPGKNSRGSSGKHSKGSPGKHSKGSPGKHSKGSPGKHSGGSPGKNSGGSSTGQQNPGSSTGSNPGASTGSNPGASPGQNNPGASPGQSNPGVSPGQNNPGASPGQNYPGASPNNYPGASPGNYPGANPCGQPCQPAPLPASQVPPTLAPPTLPNVKQPPRTTPIPEPAPTPGRPPRECETPPSDQWPSGHFCILANGPCPKEFNRHFGYMRSMALESGDRDHILPMHFGNSKIGCYGDYCGQYLNWVGELFITACCK